MDARGESCVTISKKTGIPDKTIRNIIHGETLDPRISTVHSIVKTLSGSLDYIMGLAVPPTGAPAPAPESEMLKHMREQLEAKKDECAGLNTDLVRIRKLYLETSKQASVYSAKSKARGIALIVVCACAVLCASSLVYLLWEIANPTLGNIRF